RRAFRVERLCRLSRDRLATMLDGILGERHGDVPPAQEQRAMTCGVAGRTDELDIAEQRNFATDERQTAIGQHPVHLEGRQGRIAATVLAEICKLVVM